MAVAELKELGNSLRDILPGFRKEVPAHPLLAPKAEELWHMIAPNREPDQGKAALFRFHYTPRGLVPTSQEDLVFDQILRPYWRNEKDEFSVFLSVDPHAYDGVKELRFLNLISFQLTITAEPPFTHLRGRVPVLKVIEIPQSHDSPYDIRIYGDGYQRYSGKTNFEVCGINPQDGILLWSPAIDGPRLKPEGDLNWRIKFVELITDRFIQMVTKSNTDYLSFFDECNQYVTEMADLQLHHTIFETIFPDATEFGREVMARRAALRFSMKLNPNSRLTRRELDILTILHQKAGGPISGSYLEKSLMWVEKREVRQLIENLRRKLEADSKKPQVITSVRGKGYSLRSIESEGSS